MSSETFTGWCSNSAPPFTKVSLLPAYTSLPISGPFFYLPASFSRSPRTRQDWRLSEPGRGLSVRDCCLCLWTSPLVTLCERVIAFQNKLESFAIKSESLAVFHTSWALFMHISSVQSLSRVQLFASPWTAAHQASLSITYSQSFLKLMYIESVMPSNQLIFCHPLLLLPSIFPNIRVFSNQLFVSGGQSIEASASASVLPMNIQDWFSIEWTGWIALQSKGLSRVSPTPQFKSINSSALSFLYSPTLTSIHYYYLSI